MFDLNVPLLESSLNFVVIKMVDEHYSGAIHGMKNCSITDLIQ
jgi:hypothetical protein